MLIQDNLTSKFLIITVKTLLPNKVTFTGPRDLIWISWDEEGALFMVPQGAKLREKFLEPACEVRWSPLQGWLKAKAIVHRPQFLYSSLVQA